MTTTLPVSCLVILLCVVAVYSAGGPFNWLLEFRDQNSVFAPIGRYHHGFALLDRDHGVLVGGYDFETGGLFLSDTWIYQISTRQWKFALNNSALQRAYFTVNPHRGGAIAYGGNGKADNGVGLVYGDVWRYHYSANTWIKDTVVVPPAIANLLPRQFHAAAIHHDKLYVFGGHTQIYGYTTNDLLSYDLLNNTWALLQRSGSPVGPPPRQGHTLLPYEDPFKGPSLILFGGYSDRPWNEGYNDTWQYVINTTTWIQLSNTTAGPSARYGHSGIVADNSTIVIYGGMTTIKINTPAPEDIYYSDVWALKLYGGGNSQWVNLLPSSAVPAGPGARQGHTTAHANHTLYLVAGYVQYQGLSNDVWSLQVQNITV